MRAGGQISQKNKSKALNDKRGRPKKPPDRKGQRKKKNKKDEDDSDSDSDHGSDYSQSSDSDGGEEEEKDPMMRPIGAVDDEDVDFKQEDITKTRHAIHHMTHDPSNNDDDPFKERDSFTEKLDMYRKQAELTGKDKTYRSQRVVDENSSDFTERERREMSTLFHTLPTEAIYAFPDNKMYVDSVPINMTYDTVDALANAFRSTTREVNILVRDMDPPRQDKDQLLRGYTYNISKEMFNRAMLYHRLCKSIHKPLYWKERSSTSGDAEGLGVFELLQKLPPHVGQRSFKRVFTIYCTILTLALVYQVDIKYFDDFFTTKDDKCLVDRIRYRQTDEDTFVEFKQLAQLLHRDGITSSLGVYFKKNEYIPVFMIFPSMGVTYSTPQLYPKHASSPTITSANLPPIQAELNYCPVDLDYKGDTITTTITSIHPLSLAVSTGTACLQAAISMELIGPRIDDRTNITRLINTPLTISKKTRNHDPKPMFHNELLRLFHLLRALEANPEVKEQKLDYDYMHMIPYLDTADIVFNTQSDNKSVVDVFDQINFFFKVYAKVDPNLSFSSIINI